MSKELDHSMFAKYVVQKWQTKIRELGVEDTKALFNSFVYEVRTNAAGNVDRMIFVFNYYGRMVDMGVGKGITLDDVGISDRAPKRWFTPVLFAEVGKLSKLMALDLAFKVNKSIVDALKD